MNFWPKTYTMARVLVLWMVVVHLNAQEPVVQWTKTFGGSDGDYGNDIQQTLDGGYIIAGQTHYNSSDINSGDAWLLRLDSDGDTLWTKTLGGDRRDDAHSVVTCPDGGFLIAASSASFGAEDRDLWLIRTDAHGDTIWTKAYGGADEDYPAQLTPTADGGYFIVGSTRSYGAGATDLWILRVDTDGDTLWTNTFGGSAQDIGESVVQTSDGGFLAVGRTFSLGSPGQPDLLMIRTNTHGDSLWTKVYNGRYFDWSFDGGANIQETNDGGFIVAGETNGPNHSGYFNAWLVRTDANGDTLWSNQYGETGFETGYAVEQTSDNGYLLVASTLISGGSGTDALLIRTDELGDTLWTSRIGDVNTDLIYSMSETDDGGFILTGYTDSSGEGAADVWVLRLAAESTTNIAPTSSNRPVSFTLLQNYPNPFNPSTAITLRLTEDSRIDLTIYDVNGRKVRQLAQENFLPSGQHSFMWNATNQFGKAVASGVYYYRLAVDGIPVQARKMLLIR